MSLVIRPARAGEAQLILQFIRELAEYERMLDRVSADEAAIDALLFCERPRAFCDIAEFEGTPIGFALWFYNVSTFRGGCGLYLEDLYVRPDARGLGAGKALLAGLARRCVDEGLGRLDWAVLDWNAPSIAFYDSLGAGRLTDWITRRLEGEALTTLAASAPAPLSPDVAAFIRANLTIVEPSFAPGVRLYQAHPASGLRRLIGDDAPPPYWAYTWAGGAALVRHLYQHPEIVKGRRVLDLGAGSGLVGIVAAHLGASEIIAAEIDPHSVVAIGLNAALNGTAVSIHSGDALAGAPLPVDLVLVGDLFYAPELAKRTLACLDRYLAAGVEVLIGDPGRDDLPLGRLQRVGDYAVPDFGDGASGEPKSSGVFTLIASASSTEPVAA